MLLSDLRSFVLHNMFALRRFIIKDLQYRYKSLVDSELAFFVFLSFFLRETRPYDLQSKEQSIYFGQQMLELGCRWGD